MSFCLHVCHVFAWTFACVLAVSLYVWMYSAYVHAWEHGSEGTPMCVYMCKKVCVLRWLLVCVLKKCLLQCRLVRQDATGLLKSFFMGFVGGWTIRSRWDTAGRGWGREGEARDWKYGFEKAIWSYLTSVSLWKDSFLPCPLLLSSTWWEPTPVKVPHRSQGKEMHQALDSCFLDMLFVSNKPGPVTWQPRSRSVLYVLGCQINTWECAFPPEAVALVTCHST